jgi:hypothetical protein
MISQIIMKTGTTKVLCVVMLSKLTCMAVHFIHHLIFIKMAGCMVPSAGKSMKSCSVGSMKLS